MSDALRKFGSKLVGPIPWGTHLCQFYENKQDLIDILVPYFAEGLRNNEFCMWVTSPPLEVEEARKSLKESVPNLDDYIKKGQIEIISYKNWYLLGGKFDSKKVLQGWVDKEKAALEHGFEGLRLTGNTFWIERDLWNSFVDYEEAINSVIGEHRMIAVCTYCLLNCSGTDVLDVVRNHVGTLIKQGRKWSLVEDASRRKIANGALKLSEQKYKFLFENMVDGFAYHKILLDDKGKPVDYVFLEANTAFEKLTGLKRASILGKKATEVLPGIDKDPADWIGVYGKVALTGEPVQFENYAVPLCRWYLVTAFSPEKGYFVATFEDITERKKMEQEVANSLKESKQSEAEISALLKASKAVLQNKEFSDSARAIFDACKELIGATAGYVALLSNTGKENEVLFLDSGGLPCTVDPSLPMPIRGLRAEAYKSGKVAFENNFPQSEWKKFSPKGHVQLKNVLFAPLMIEQRVVGVIGLANKREGFAKRDSEMASAFGELASVALANSQMLEMLEENEKQLKVHSEHLETLVEERTKQLRDSERLAAIGATAGMVGHDIRNPLQAITGDVFLAKTELASIPDGDEKKNAMESLQEIETNVDYINKIVADLQDFARPLKPKAEETDLKLLIDELLRKKWFAREC